MQYFFNDQLRWSLGWDTPNQAGALIATLLPWLWALTSWALGRILRPGARRTGWIIGAAGFAALEVGASWALVKTYSRGAFVAAVAALGLMLALEVWRRGSARRQAGMESSRRGAGRLAPWLGRAALLAVLLAVSGFGQRLEPDYAAKDRSVTNRVDLWKGGIELAAISPWRGWGWGNSGASFMHWTQPVGRAEGYKSMVNSYLTVGVEGGLPVLALVLVGCGAVLWLGLVGVSRTPGGVGAAWATEAAAASWLAWLVALFFSNLWIIPGLWVVPGLTLAWLGWQIVRRRAWRGAGRSLVVLTAFAGVVCGGLWLAGARWEASSSVAIARAANGDVTLARRQAGAAAREGVVLPDAQVLGEAYGQELRRWVGAATAPAVRLRVIVSPGEPLPPGCPVVAFGAACNDARLKGRQVVLVHPVQSPDDGCAVAPGSIVQLAGIDVAGHNPEWEDWADEHGVTVKKSLGLATDARAGWPRLAFAWRWQ